MVKLEKIIKLKDRAKEIQTEIGRAERSRVYHEEKLDGMGEGYTTKQRNEVEKVIEDREKQTEGLKQELLDTQREAVAAGW